MTTNRATHLSLVPTDVAEETPTPSPFDALFPDVKEQLAALSIRPKEGE